MRSATTGTVLPSLLSSLLLGLLWVMPAPGQAQEAATGDEDPPAGLVGRATGFVDYAQRNASENFSNFMTQVDGFFTDVPTGEETVSNRSWARVRLDARRPAGESFDFKPSVKLRIELPNTEKRFKLLLSTEDDDTDVVGESVDPAQSVQSSGDRNASAAIRFVRSAREKGSVNLDIGVRQRDGEIQYFGRISSGYRTMLARRWDFRAANSYWHYNKSGFENRLTFDFRRLLFYREDLFFRSYTDINWRKGRKGAFVGQTIGIYTQFGERKSLALEALAGYHTALNSGVEDRYRGHEIRVRWRHNVWRPWFYYEVWPSVSWPASVDYEQSYGFLFRIEAVIGQQ